MFRVIAHRITLRYRDVLLDYPVLYLPDIPDSNQHFRTDFLPSCRLLLLVSVNSSIFAYALNFVLLSALELQTLLDCSKLVLVVFSEPSWSVAEANLLTLQIIFISVSIFYLPITSNISRLFYPTKWSWPSLRTSMLTVTGNDYLTINVGFKEPYWS